MVSIFIGSALPPEKEYLFYTFDPSQGGVSYYCEAESCSDSSSSEMTLLTNSSSLFRKETSLLDRFSNTSLSASSTLETLVLAFFTMFLRKTRSLLRLLLTFQNSLIVCPLGSLEEQLKEEQQEGLTLRMSLISFSSRPSLPLLEQYGVKRIIFDFSQRMYMIFLNSSSSSASLQQLLQVPRPQSCRLVWVRNSLMLLLLEAFLDSLKLVTFWKGLNLTSGTLREREELSWMELNFGLAISTIISLRMLWMRPISSLNRPFSFIFMLLSHMDLMISSASSSYPKSAWLNSPLQSSCDRPETAYLSSVKQALWYASSLTVLLAVRAQTLSLRVFCRVTSEGVGSLLLFRASLTILMGCLRSKE